MNNRRRNKNTALSDTKRLEIFLSCIEELKTRPFILNGLDKFQFQIEFDTKTGEPRCELNETDEELLRSFLITLRKFTMNGELANIDSVLNICRKHIKPEQKKLRDTLEELRASWKYRYRKGALQMRVNNLNLTPEYVLDLFNSQTFHSSNLEKSEQLRKLSKQSIPCARIQLLCSLPGLTEIILDTGLVVSKALKENAFDFLS